MTASALDRVRQIVADVFGLALDQVDAQSSPESIEAWESIAHLNLVLSLEQAFRVSFTPDEIAELVSVEAIVSKVHMKLSHAA